MKLTKVTIDRMNVVDNNNNVTVNIDKNSLSKKVPVYVNYNHLEPPIGTALVNINKEGIDVIGNIEFNQNFDLDKMPDKFHVAPEYRAIEKKEVDGVTYITKAELLEVSVITSKHSVPSIKASTKKDIKDAN